MNQQVLEDTQKRGDLINIIDQAQIDILKANNSETAYQLYERPELLEQLKTNIQTAHASLSKLKALMQVEDKKTLSQVQTTFDAFEKRVLFKVQKTS